MTGDIAAYPDYRALAEREFDALVYDPGHFGRAGERRWSTVEGARSWARHCLGHAGPGSLVAVAMPGRLAFAADARTLRGVLLRGGLLRAILSGIPDSPDLWLLRQSEKPSAHVLLVNAAGEPAYALRAWRAFEEDPMHPDAIPHTARVVELLDADIDLSPRGLGDPQDGYPALRDELAGVFPEAPALEAESGSHGTISLEELVEAGTVTIYQASPAAGADEGDSPVLSVKDVRLGRAPSRRGSAEMPGAVTIRGGDIAVAIGSAAAVRVCAEDGALLGTGIHLVRTNSAVVDPSFLAGVLRAAVEAEDGPVDLYQVSVPRIPPAEQRRYGAAFERLNEFEAEWQRRRAVAEALVRTGFQGLAQGRLRPPEDAE
ncbi:hypothetical protein ABZ319_36740 [Nocardia sp. NPDC005978]|uniref:hypothetical protein n=1 Tax=Nocardia sp. NPDC005978 TaxID=3156725 RepID=UPI0033B3EFBC